MAETTSPWPRAACLTPVHSHKNVLSSCWHRPACSNVLAKLADVDVNVLVLAHRVHLGMRNALHGKTRLEQLLEAGVDAVRPELIADDDCRHLKLQWPLRIHSLWEFSRYNSK